MKFNELRTGMLFRNNQPPPYFAIIKYGEDVFTYGFHGDEVTINPLDEWDWADYFEDSSDKELVDVSQVNGSLLQTIVKMLFERRVYREDL